MSKLQSTHFLQVMTNGALSTNELEACTHKYCIRPGSHEEDISVVAVGLELDKSRNA